MWRTGDGTRNRLMRKKQVGEFFSELVLVRSPIRRDLKFYECLGGIICLDGNFEQVLAFHALMHREIDVNQGLLTGL